MVITPFIASRGPSCGGVLACFGGFSHGRQLWVIKDLSKDRADFGNGGAPFCFLRCFLTPWAHTRTHTHTLDNSESRKHLPVRIFSCFFQCFEGTKLSRVLAFLKSSNLVKLKKATSRTDRLAPKWWFNKGNPLISGEI